MKNITMDLLAEKEAQIERLRQAAVDGYPSMWRGMISAWDSPGAEDCAWLIYAANYLLRTGNVRWAVDPLGLNWRLPDAPRMDVRRDLAPLKFVLITHNHKDHLDEALLAELASLPICWVIPEFLAGQVRKRCGLADEKMIAARPLQPVELEGLRITPFEAPHFVHDADGTLHGVPELGYLVEQAGKRWLFPGDIRNYEAGLLPEFGPVDVLFAHLWLGRGAALQQPLPGLEDFCRFFGSLHPRRVILAHLQEFGRKANDFWDARHVRQVLAACPDMHIQPAYMGERVTL